MKAATEKELQASSVSKTGNPDLNGIIKGTLVNDTVSNTESINTEPKDSTNFSYEFEPPVLKGTIKRNADDFQVIEKLKFELNGEGQHLCLLGEKKLLNTQDA